jgi:hypothetical protein
MYAYKHVTTSSMIQGDLVHVMRVDVPVKRCCVLNKCSEGMVRIKYVLKLQHQSHIQSNKCMYKVALKLNEFNSMDTHTVTGL